MSIEPFDNDPLDNSIDFSKGQRGKFYRRDMRLHIPVYLEPAIMDKLTEIANRKGIQLDDLVSDLLRRELATAETLR
ncbi:MAG: hypothetical protein IT168_11455 [Bryobacterales bacterium]|nr:hypothetical protein [Bryobacterales bacterium]